MTSNINDFGLYICVRYHLSCWYHKGFEWAINRGTITKLAYFVTTSHGLPYVLCSTMWTRCCCVSMTPTCIHSYRKNNSDPCCNWYYIRLQRGQSRSPFQTLLACGIVHELYGGQSRSPFQSSSACDFVLV